MAEKDELIYVKDSIKVVTNRIHDYFCNNNTFNYDREEILQDLELILSGRFKKEDRG